MNNLKHALLSVAFILLFIHSLSAQTDKAKEIERLMSKTHQLGIFNGNVLVVEKGKIVYQAEFGFSDAGKKTKLAAAYRFNIGSIAKEFNAVGIMMLKEQGKLSLDDKVSKHLTDLPAWAEKISVRNLLQYASGLPDINWKTVKGDADILSDLKSAKELNFEPGTKYAYNNSNVFLQRRIIEKLSGVSFQRFVEQKMLRPCGMKSSVVDPDLRGDKNIAVSFNNDFVEDARQFTYPMSGWTSVTAQDLYKWTRCLYGYKLIDQVSFVEILTPFAPGNQSGLGKGEMAGGVVKQHSHQGTSGDFEALLYSEPASGLTIILLTNNKNSKVFEIKDAVKSILRGEPYKMPKRSLYTVLMKRIDDANAGDFVKIYKETKAAEPDVYDFDNETALNRFGYSLMSRKRFAEAVRIFELNVELFPESANARDSLREARLASQQDKK